ncbi:MAG: ABC transporter permease [Dehalococcoidia bacterium]|nr:ABC transporter permease [Dehalococcoidia bacterium]
MARAWSVLWRFCRRKPLGAVGGAFILMLVLVAIFAPLLTSYDPIENNTDVRLQPPSATHPLGTDQLGRDVWSRTAHGARTSLSLGIGSVLLGTLVALVLGVLGGYMGGALDMVLDRIIDAIMAFPWILLMLTLLSVLGASVLNLAVALAVAMAPRNTRVVRSAVLSLREAQYVEAAHAIGASHLRIIGQHILPNIMAPAMVLVSVYLGWAILVESSVSFIGFGVPPPLPSWGRTLAEEGRRFMFQAPWLATVPGIAISLAVFGFNMLGDALRDVLDPRMRGSQ